MALSRSRRRQNPEMKMSVWPLLFQHTTRTNEKTETSKIDYLLREWYSKPNQIRFWDWERDRKNRTTRSNNRYVRWVCLERKNQTNLSKFNKMLFNEQQKTWHFDACNCVPKHTDKQTGRRACKQEKERMKITHDTKQRCPNRYKLTHETVVFD